MRPLVQVQPGPPHRGWPVGTLAGGLLQWRLLPWGLRTAVSERIPPALLSSDDDGSSIEHEGQD